MKSWFSKIGIIAITLLVFCLVVILGVNSFKNKVIEKNELDLNPINPILINREEKPKDVVGLMGAKIIDKPDLNDERYFDLSKPRNSDYQLINPSDEDKPLPDLNDERYFDLSKPRNSDYQLINPSDEDKPLPDLNDERYFDLSKPRNSDYQLINPSDDSSQ